VHRWSKMLKRWRPPVVHIGRPSRKKRTQDPITMYIRYLKTVSCCVWYLDTAQEPITRVRQEQEPITRVRQEHRSQSLGFARNTGANH
jgi:hypothetical protein